MAVNQQRNNEDEGGDGSQEITGQQNTAFIHAINKDTGGRAQDQGGKTETDNGETDEDSRTGYLLDQYEHGIV